MKEKNSQLGTINLFNDKQYTIPDSNVRYFPKFWDVVRSFLTGHNDSIILKSSLDNDCLVDWAVGSFLVFKIELYK